jgi:hypothetical protein
MLLISHPFNATPSSPGPFSVSGDNCRRHFDDGPKPGHKDGFHARLRQENRVKSQVKAFEIR